MTYIEFLQRVIDEGAAAAEQSYANDPPKRRGALAGFRACEGKLPPALASLLRETQMAVEDARPSRTRRGAESPEEVDAYWEARCYAAEVEWVCNCVSAALANMDLPVIVRPTARGVMKAASILGVSEMQPPQDG